MRSGHFFAKFLMRTALLFLSTVSVLAAWQQTPTHADQRIAMARQQIAGDGKAFQGYNQLATALCRKGRDTSDVAYYNEAKVAVDKSLELSAGNYDAVKLRVEVLLGQHEFQQALKLAQEINKKGPDDIAVWGFLVDVNTALGNYSEAERDAQWILDLRSGSALGFEKAAELREVFGDSVGASEFYGEALRRTAQSDLDQRAWLLTQRARIAVASGDAKSAGEILPQVFALFPGSQAATLVMADVQTANGKFSEAAGLFEKCYRSVPSTADLYAWASSLERAGQKDEAAKELAAFESKARAEIGKPYNANLELIAYYADRKNDAAEALRIANIESARRQDAPTLAALAWALYDNGKFADAKTQIDKALAVGIREPDYFCHAAQISAKANNAADAAKFEKEAATFGMHSCLADHPIQAALGDSK
jgi:tetratricopeptide (TPR) repeat protein